MHRDIAEFDTPVMDGNLRELAERSVTLTERVILKATQTVREFSKGEFCVLLFLESLDQDTTAVEIADQVSLTRPRITQIVSSLERRGFVTREKDEFDKRKVNIRITDEGRRVVNEQREQTVENHMRYLAKLGDDSEAFLRILEKSVEYFAEKELNSKK